MRDTVVDHKFNRFRVDHKEAHLVRCRAEKYAHDDRVHAYRLTGACGAGDKDMGHLCDICDNDVAGNALAEDCAQLALCLAEFLRIHHFAERNAFHGLVRHFYANRRLVRDRRFDAHSRRCEVQRDIVHKSGDL